MKTVTKAHRAAAGKPVVICDVSPPRESGPGSLDEAASLDADFLSVAYNPGQSVRVNSAFAAKYLSDRHGKPTVFTLATRDMNRIAIQSLLLGASWTGLHNVVVVRGDPIRAHDRDRVTTVGDYTTTALLSDIAAMNLGIDFRGLSLSRPTSFCAGATVDIGRGFDAEASLAERKLASGAEFLLSQAHFNPADIREIQRRLPPLLGETPPVFAGVQVLDPAGIDFGNVPDAIRRELDAGRPGLDIARELAHELWSAGITNFYVIPPIRPRGVRDYTSAADLIDFIRAFPAIRPP